MLLWTKHAESLLWKHRSRHKAGMFGEHKSCEESICTDWQRGDTCSGNHRQHFVGALALPHYKHTPPHIFLWKQATRGLCRYRWHTVWKKGDREQGSGREGGGKWTEETGHSACSGNNKKKHEQRHNKGMVIICRECFRSNMLVV